MPPIRTQFINPPIPVREMDWAAWYDGREEGPVGHGPSEGAAIADLLAQEVQ